jgi:hypothetical protein
LTLGREVFARDAWVRSTQVTEAGTFWREWPATYSLYRIGLPASDAGSVRAIPTELQGPMTIAGFTPRGELVFGGKVGGLPVTVIRDKTGATRLLEGATGRPEAVVGDGIIVAIQDKEETRLVRAGNGSPVELGVAPSFGGVICAGERAPPCLLAEREGDWLRLFAWSVDDGKRGREVGKIASSRARQCGLALSPDGKVVAYCTPRVRHLGLLELESGTMRDLAVRDITVEQEIEHMTWETRDTLLAVECCDPCRVIRVGLDGTRTVLAESDTIWFREPHADPDGKDIFVVGIDIGASFWWAPEYTTRR